MITIKKTMVLLIAISLTGLAACGGQSSGKKDSGSDSNSSKADHKYNVLFEYDIPNDEPQKDRWQKGLNNIDNLMDEYGEDVHIEVVAHGDGGPFFLKNPVKNSDGEVTKNVPSYKKQLKEFAEKGVDLRMCENTMANIGADKDDLYSFVGTVSSGVGEVVKRQKEGWQYIKAE